MDQIVVAAWSGAGRLCATVGHGARGGGGLVVLFALGQSEPKDSVAHVGAQGIISYGHECLDAPGRRRSYSYVSRPCH